MATSPAGSGDAFRVREEAARGRELESDSPVAPCEEGAARGYDGPEHEMPVEERETAECHPIHGGEGSGHHAPLNTGPRGETPERAGRADPYGNPPAVRVEQNRWPQASDQEHQHGRPASRPIDKA